MLPGLLSGPIFEQIAAWSRGIIMSLLTTSSKSALIGREIRTFVVYAKKLELHQKLTKVSKCQVLYTALFNANVSE